MRNRTQLWIGLALVILGLFYLAGILLDVNLSGSFWPIVLILLGIFLLLRPTFGGAEAGDFRFFGEVVRGGAWQVRSQDLWAFIGDVKMDLTEAEIPEGETVIRLNAFIADMKVKAPPEIAVAISSAGFISDTRLFENKQESFFAPVEIQTPGYDSAPRKIRLETAGFISGLKVRAA